MSTISGLRSGLLLSVGMLVAGAALAQGGPGGYPTKPVRVVIPAAAGSLTDPVGRIVTEELARRTGQAWVIDNRPGAGGMIGSENVARSAADGYSLLFTANNFIITPSLYPTTIRYKVTEDFTPIGLVGRADNLLVASAAAGVKNIQELVAAARRAPVGPRLHVAAARVCRAPHGGTVPKQRRHQAESHRLQGRDAGDVGHALRTDSGQHHGDIDRTAYIRAGKLVPLAWTGPKRASQLPDTPTFVEAGFKDVHLGLWFGYFGPAKMPAAQVGWLNQQIAAALKHPATVEKLAGIGIEPIIASADALGEMVAREQPVYAKVVADAGLKLE